MKMKIAVLLAASLMAAGLQAQLRLPAVISDSMVLQRNTEAPIWGWADPGQQVRVKASWSASATISTVAGADGKWSLKLKTPAAGGPYTISISAGETKLLKGVMSGEVWICSGQSNMEMPVKGWPPNDLIKESEKEIAAADYPAIRMFTVAHEMGFSTKDDVKGSWLSASPASAGGFSATAYFFGRKIYEELHVPVGLIHTSWGGTIAEAWTSEEQLRPLKDFNKELDRIDSARRFAQEMIRQDQQQETAWSDALKETNNLYAGENVNDHDWKKMTLPGNWEKAGLPDFDGIMWYRKEVEIPAAWAGKTLQLELGPIDDEDITWFNGIKAGTTTGGNAWFTPRSYEIPAGLVKTGKNVIVVRVTDVMGAGGLYGDIKQLRLYPKDNNAAAISLAGEWKYLAGLEKKKPVMNYWPNQPSVLYNAMIYPLLSYRIRGAIWYQGESNVGRARQYEYLFPAMIADWRRQWKQGNFPFYFVQIAPFIYGGDSTEAAALRDAQRKTLAVSPNTGMAVTMDIGNPRNIHPGLKKEVGERLARWALAQAYGKKNIVVSGPLYKKTEVKGNEVWVTFTHTEGGLSSKGLPLKDFELAGADNKWFPASARIEGGRLVVTSSAVEKPLAVRYAWYGQAQASLFNGTGLPASSFSSK